VLVNNTPLLVAGAVLAHIFGLFHRIRQGKRHFCRLSPCRCGETIGSLDFV